MGLHGMRSYDLRDTDALLYQVRYEALMEAGLALSCFATAKITFAWSAHWKKLDIFHSMEV